MAKTKDELTADVDKKKIEYEAMVSQYKVLGKALNDKRIELIKAQGVLEAQQ